MMPDVAKTKTSRVAVLSNTAPRQKWVDRISAAWRDQVPAIFETGNLLEAAKEELKHGEWLIMVKEELPFTRQTANKLMIIADDDKIRNDAHGRHLPCQWTTLYELTKLNDEQFSEGIKSGSIHPKMERKDVAALRGIEPKKKEPETDPVGLSNPERACVNARKIIVSTMKQMSPDDQLHFISLVRLQLDDLEAMRKAA